MFGKDDISQLSGYRNSINSGTEYLRASVTSKIYSGDSLLEQKLTQMQLYWKYYNNQHWASNNDKLLSFNYVRAIIDKVINFMVGKDGFEVNVEDTYGDTISTEFEKFYEGVLSYNWNRNNKKVLLQKLLQMGSICGDAYVFLYPNISKGYIEYILLDSRVTYPLFKNGNQNEVIGYRVIKVLGKNQQEYVQKVTEYTETAITSYYTKGTGVEAEKYEVSSQENVLKTLPIVHFENIPMADNFGGKSDMEDILKINKVYNEMAEDIKNIIDYYAAPTTIVTGGTIGQLQKGVNQIWSGLPSDANVFNLGLGEDLGASNEFLRLLKNAMHDLSGVPEEVLSKVQHISNTSASALQMLYQPIIQVSDKKGVSYGEGIKELHKKTLILYHKVLKTHPLYVKLSNTEEYSSYFNAIDSNEVKSEEIFYERYITDIVWKYNLPNDRMSVLNEAQIELSQKIASRKEIMERLGKRGIPKILEQIEEDVKENIQNERELNSIKQTESSENQ